MHQTMKGNQWHFGMKVHIGVDSASVLVHNAGTNAATCTTASNDPTCCMGGNPAVW